MKRWYLALMILFGFCIVKTAFANQEIPKGDYLIWNYKLGINERFRMEYKDNFDFNDSKKDQGNQFYNRFRLSFGASLTDEYLQPKMDIFVEGLDAQVGCYRIKANYGQADDFDLHQAYVDTYNVLGSDLDIKLGRQELKYGKGRLIAAPTWANRIRSFDAAVFHYHRNGLYADFLYGQDVKYIDDRFNRSSDREFLSGVYAGYQKDGVSPLFEGYFLTQYITNVSPKAKRYTVGLRSQGKLFYGIVYDIEAPYQFGELGAKEISAFAVHADLSKSYEQLFWSPQAILEFNLASGNKDPNKNVSNTFIPLYQTTHEPYGLMDFFRWENMREVDLKMNFFPTSKLKLNPQINFFWLDSKYDSWYDSTGKAIRTKLTGNRGTYVGSEVSLVATYDLNKNIQLESGAAHFFTGAYVKDTGPNDDANWFYLQATLKY